MAFSYRSFAVFIFVVLCQLRYVYSKDGFIATLPQVLRHRTRSEFCLTMYNADQSSRQMSFRLENTDSGLIPISLDALYTPGLQKCTDFEVPEPGVYELVISNDTDALHDPVKIQVNEDQPLTLMQTDKPIYKPGQTVKFRILTLLYNMRPRIGQISSVYISDPNDIRVKQYLDVDNKGLTSLEFQLVDRAKLGEWTIEVNLEDGSKPTKTTFQVDEYVLPRFDITITPPSYILATDESIEGKVCAMYTYGKPVTGFLDLKIYWSSSRSFRYNQVVKLSGCHNFTVNRTELIQSGPMVPWRRSYLGELQFEASVTEAGTGVVVNKTESGPSEGFELLKITIDDYTNGFFKPGLQYLGKVTVTKPDGTPASGETIRVRATTSPVTSRYSQNFTTDENGVLVFALCDSFTENSTSIGLEAMAIEYEERDQSKPPSEVSLFTPQGYKSINQWFSPSLSYIQIPKLEAECDTQITLSIPFTTVANKDATFTYQIMSRGQIVKTGQVIYNHTQAYPGTDYSTPDAYCLKSEEIATEAVPSSSPDDSGDDENDESEAVVDFDDEPGPPIPHDVIDETSADSIIEPPYPDEIREPVVRSAVVSNTKANFILDFIVTTEMSPSFTLLVYHILDDGEVVADSMEFLVKPCFANKVSFDFNKTQALPGEDVELTVVTSPGSVCGVGVVDKSVNILGGDHQITPDVVFKRIEASMRNQYNFMPTLYDGESDYCEERMKKLADPSRSDEYWFYNSPYVDAIQAFKSSEFRVLTNLNLETRPCERHFPIYYASVTGERPMTMGRGGGLTVSQGPRIRSNFPETWLWDLVDVGASGVSVIKKKAPDTVTTWVGNALCVDQTTGFGVSKMTALTTFQPFFVSLQLPYSAVRGERLPVILTIYNYLDKCLHIQMSLNVDEDFEVFNARRNKEPICLCDGKSHSARYYVTPKNIGSLEIKAKAAVIPGSCSTSSVEMDLDYAGYSDAVKRQMLVKAEGVTQEYSTSMYICSKEGEPSTEDVILPLPDNMVKDSARGAIKVIGDIMGPAIASTEQMVRMPTGCGEQNMVGFVPNIVVLKYLTNTGRITEEIETKAKKYMEIGYQRELTYRHEDGSYSAFGEKDPKGSVWLTAFVVKSFAQAKPYIYVDEDQIQLSIRFLRRSQLETGCFRETGKVISSYMMGGLGKSKRKTSYTALTAYVLAALLKADVNSMEQVIKEGIRCMNRDFNNQKGKIDSYTLSLVAYVNTLYNPFSHTSRQIMKTLDVKAKKDGSLRYWGRDTAKPPAVNTWYYYAAPSAEVEMTSYALLAQLNFYGEQTVAQTHDVAMWLSQQRNSFGGFSSTQDTVIGLQALSEFAELAYSDEGVDVRVSVSGEDLEREFRVSEELKNTLLLQSEPITKLPNRIQIETSGVGCALVQASVSYNKPADKILTEGRPPFYLKVVPKLHQLDINRCDRRTLKFNLRLRNRKFSSGMTLLSVRMVTGWRPLEDSLLRLQSQFPLLGIKQHEYKEDKGLLTFYFDEMSRKMKTFTLDIEQDRELATNNPKPADVKLLQYYETDVSVVKSYKVRTTCGTKQELPYKKPEGGDEIDETFSQVRIGISRDFPRASAVTGMDKACPKCSGSKRIPANLKDLVCRSAAVYKAIAGRKGRKPLKIKTDMKPLPRGRNVSTFAKYEMPKGCQCEQLRPPNKRVIIFVKEEMKRKTVLLNESSVVLPVFRGLDKEIRKSRRACQKQNSQS